MPRASSNSAMKILIVDDSKEERARLVDAFNRSTEYVVVGAVARLHTAFHALGESPPDVVVTDVILGDDHATHLIMAARRCVVPPAIVVYASTDAVDERRRCIEAGADRFVAKAAGFGALERVITDLAHVRAFAQPSASDRFSLIGRIAAGAAHDLNNYLGVIDVSLALMKKQLAGQPLAEEVTSLRRAVESAIRLTSNMTRYARGSSPPFGPVHLAEVTQRVLEMFGRSLSPEVKVALDVDPVPAIDGVELEIEQLVLNLVLNASDAIAGGGTVMIRLRTHSGMVRFEIEDTGRGMGIIETDDVALTRSTKRESAGLGLGIVRSIASRHGAMLKIDGPTSRITIDFPVTPRS
jgi:signal transduction histidine kinase